MTKMSNTNYSIWERDIKNKRYIGIYVIIKFLRGLKNP